MKRNSLTYIKKHLLLCLCLLVTSTAFSQFQLNINTTVVPPANSAIRDYVTSGRINTTFKNNTGETVYSVYVYGQIERLSPAPFTLSGLMDVYPQNPAIMDVPPNASVPVSQDYMLRAFNNFNPAAMRAQGIAISELLDNNNRITLPPGTYRICFTALNPNYGQMSTGGANCGTFTITSPTPANAVTINTQLIPPADPDILRQISRGYVRPVVLFNNPAGQQVAVKLFGKIESLSPKPFIIALNPDHFEQPSVNLSPSMPVQLTPQQVMDAFGNFNPDALVTTGISLDELRDDKNILKLPEGMYKMCFYARYDHGGQLGDYASNANLGCTNFNICYKAAAPQFSQPVSNFNIRDAVQTVRAASPVIFAWTPPNATCGANLSKITYDFEIREMFEGQTPTDAINNPPVYQKTGLRTSSFVFDTLLNKQVLQQGKRYVIRVKADAGPNSEIEIDNYGYSRAEAFVYGETLREDSGEQKPEEPKPGQSSTIPTSVIKGRVIWSFKKSEEEMAPKIDNQNGLDALIKNIPAFHENQGKEPKKSAAMQAIDPNLKVTAIQSSFNTISNQLISPAASQTISSSVSGDGKIIEKTDLRLPSQKGKVTHPLKGATIKLMGVKSNKQQTITDASKLRTTASITLSKQLGIAALPAASAQRAGTYTIPATYQMPEEKDQAEDLIASGGSDSDGNFTFHFIDPKYKNVNQYSRMRIVIEHPDFESYSSEIPVVMPDENGDVDLGNIQLTAKTYRFTPYVTNQGAALMKFAVGGSQSKIELYFPGDAIQKYPHYAKMAKEKTVATTRNIAGRAYTLIAELQNGETMNRLFYQKGNNDFVIRITEQGMEDYYSYLGVRPSAYSFTGSQLTGGKPVLVDESEMIISVKAEYSLKRILPFITGNVKVSLGEEGLLFPEGAIVTVAFDRKKVVEQYQGSELKPGPAEAQKNEPVKMDVKATNIQSVNNNQTQKATVSTALQGYTFAVNNPKPAATGQGDLVTSVRVNPDIINLSVLTMYQTVTDGDGNFRIDNLPVLEDGNYFTVTVKTKEKLEDSRGISVPLKRGDSAHLDMQLNPEIFAVTGMVVNENNEPVNGATLRWKSGGNIMETDPKGVFLGSNYKDDSLTISTFGYLTKTIFVKLDKTAENAGDTKTTPPKNTKAKNAKIPEPPVLNALSVDYNNSKINTWSTSILQQPSVKAAQQSDPNPAFGFAVSKTESLSPLTSVYKELFSPLNTVKNKDIGTIKLEKGSAKVNFTVKDENGNAVAGAIIRIGHTIDTFTTNTGDVLLKGDGSSFEYTVLGPEGTDFVAHSGEVSAKEPDGTTTQVTVSLSKGIKLSGKVTSKNTALTDAEIYIDGKDFIKAKSRADGSYSIIIPKGESRIVATKKGYRGASVQKSFTAASTHNFELEDGGGRNISSLLGFEIVLENSKKDGANAEIWTGAFVNLKANSVLSTSSSAKLNFSEIKVTFDVDGNAVVAGNEVKTDVTELAMKLFGYIPLKVQGSPQITVKKSAGGKGTIGGKLRIDFGQISSMGGLAFDQTFKPLLVPLNSSTDHDVPVFSSDGSETTGEFVFSYARNEIKNAAEKAVQELKKKADKTTGEAKKSLENKLNDLRKAAIDAGSYVSSGNIPPTLPQYAMAKILGFEATLDLAKTKISAAGMDMSGFLSSPEIPVISSLLFDIETLRIGTDFSVKDISVTASTHLKFDIVTWKAELNSATFNKSGFKIGGKITIQVPKSKASDLEFSNLSIGTSGLYGGTFSLPSGGLDIFEVIQLKSGSTPITFGQVGNTNTFKIGGSASFSFGKLFSEKIELPYFQIQTDGKFAATVPVNKSLDAGFAKFGLNAITFNTTKSVPQIDIDGKFSVDVKLLSFKTSGIHFTKSGVTAERITLAVDIPAVNVEAFVDMKENGFSGGGSLSILNTPVKAGVSFFYFKEKTGTRLGADFSADVKIPLGPVIISRVGGGFTYSPNSDYFRVTISGGASVTGLETLIALDPIEITVESGPKITGKAGVKVLNALEVASATIVIDIPNFYFSIGIRSNLSPLPDIMSTSLQGDLMVSTKKGDNYFFLGAGMDVNLLGLIRSRGVYAMGFGVNNAQTRETISYYMADAPADYLSNGSFTGIYVRSMAEMGVRKENAPELDLYIASGKVWLYNRSDFSLIANFNNANFRISSSMYFEGGLEACVHIPLLVKTVSICASAQAKACVSIAGGYSSSLGWNFNASASGEGILGLGDDCSCNSLCVIGGKICVGAGARISYASKQGGLKDMGMFIGSRAKCN